MQLENNELHKMQTKKICWTRNSVGPLFEVDTVQGPQQMPEAVNSTEAMPAHLWRSLVYKGDTVRDQHQ